MLKTIFIYELKYLIRNKILIILSVVLFIISGYALFNGSSFYNKQIAVIDKLKTKDSLSYSTILEKLKSDSLEKKDPREYKSLTFASWAIFDNKFNVYWKPNPASVISIGNRDVYPYYQEILPVSLYMRLFKNEISNPNMLLIGNIDFSYIIIFVFPLFIIALLFNFSSQNKETGIQPFLFVNVLSIKKLVYTRLVFYTLIVLAILALLFFLAFFLLLNNHSYGILIKLFLLSCLFSLFWVGVCYAVNQLNRSSVFNITSLISLWLVFSVLIPSVSNQLAAYKYPINSEEITKNIRRIQLKDDDAAFEAVLKKFYAKYPHYNTPDTSGANLFSKAYLAQGQLSDLEGDSLLNGICDKMLQKQKFLTAISFANPTMCLQNYFANATETNLTDYVSYLKKLQQFNVDLKQFYFRKAFTNDRMDVNYYQLMPQWYKR